MAWKVPVKVVLLVIVVVAEPLTFVVVPIPLSMKMFEMPLPPQVSVVSPPPTPSEVGDAVSEQTGPPPPPPPVWIVTAAVQVTDPPVPVAVPEKVVLEVRAGLVVAPPATGVKAPTPLSTLKEVACVVVHVSCVVPPELICVGLTESVQVGGGVVVIVTVAVHVLVPPAPVAVPVNVVVVVSAGVEVEPLATGVTLPIE